MICRAFLALILKRILALAAFKLLGAKILDTQKFRRLLGA
jgi:hypothetical protein